MSALFPYVSSVKALFNGIDEFWARGVLKKDWSPYNWTRPESLPNPDKIDFDIDFKVKVPGDLAARANILQMLSPDAKLSPETALSLVMGELPDSRREIAKYRASLIESSPTNLLIEEILQHRAIAEAMQNRQPTIAELHQLAAEKLSAGLGVPEQPPTEALSNLSQAANPSNSALPGGGQNGNPR